MRRILTRFRWVYVTPVFAFIALLAWALASPMGASPDDDFHLTSIWCASASADANCTPGGDPITREVPQALIDSACYLPSSEESAACQQLDINFDPSSTIETQRGNFVGGYPPVYYAVMGVFVGSDIVASVVMMRVVNILVFVGLTAAIFALLPLARRPSLIWGWLVTTIPLGLFLIPSNNPSSWAIIGVGSAWIALLGWFETSGRRKIGLGIAFVASVMIAAGARGDGALYTALGIVLVLGIAFEPTKRYFMSAIVPLAALVICGYFFVSAQQVLSGFNGFGGAPSTVPGEAYDPTALLAFNILNIPTLWAGVFGTWGLGWFEVGMPTLVSFGSLASFLVVAAIGFGRLQWRKSVALASLGLALIVVPLTVLTRGGDMVGEEVQPRYILPLIVMMAGMLVLDTGKRRVVFTRGQMLLVTLTLAAVQFVALHVTMRRYITGTNEQGFNLDSGVQWWWNMPVSPMVVLFVGSAAFAALVWILAREVALRQPELTSPLLPVRTP
jgi:hypothetical protein